MKVSIESLKNELSKSFNGDLEEIKATTILNENVDSLDMMDFYMNIEELFNISIPDNDIENLKTLNDYIIYLEDKI